MNYTRPISSIYYRFSIENSWKCIQCQDNRWENVKKSIGRLLGITDNSTYCIEGYQLIENVIQSTPILENDNIKHGSRIVLKRLPCLINTNKNKETKKPPVPYKNTHCNRLDYRNTVNRNTIQSVINFGSQDLSKPPDTWNSMTEEQKITFIIDSAANIPIQEIYILGRSDSCYNASKGCNFCGDSRHMEIDCTRKRESYDCFNTKKRVPSGIPMNMFRDAVTEEEKQNAMLTLTGKLVVFKNEPGALHVDKKRKINT